MGKRFLVYPNLTHSKGELVGRIVVVDDDLSLCHFLKKSLTQKGHHILECHAGREALMVIDEEEVDLVLLDNKMPDLMGLEILKELKRRHPKLPVIIMTAFGRAETAIEAMRLGAFDYILKPFELEEVLELIAKGLKAGNLMKKRVGIPDFLEDKEGSDQIIGRSTGMQEVYKLIGQVAEKDVTVLIQGESGTGKELVAGAIYQHSRRKKGPFLRSIALQFRRPCWRVNSSDMKEEPSQGRIRDVLGGLNNAIVGQSSLTK